MKSKWPFFVKVLKVMGFGMWLILMWAVETYHVGVFPKPSIESPVESAVSPAKSVWIDRTKIGIHQMILQGTPYARGLAAGEYTKNLLYRQEKELITQLESIFPSSFLIQALEVFAIRWFLGVENYLNQDHVQEMLGVSEATSHDFDYLADRLTRQVSYHGIHEVGQMMVDQKGDGMGCTVIAYPHILQKNSHQKSRQRKNWIIGRNFDFEGGQVFDSEKIMKWVFPDTGYAFVSVIWAGMVGLVTGVNEKGLYISINAAGSTDYGRIGTPSTLVALEALQFSQTAEEAVEIIRRKKMFITDIFIVSDRNTGRLFRVEKSPKATEVMELVDPSVIANHLISPRWKDDRTNVFRREELTSHFRVERGEALLRGLSAKNSRELELKILSILRDKNTGYGNRRSIDAFIATHAVVYNEIENVLYVSKGPALSGALIGFDLSKSFANQNPVVIRQLPADPKVSEDFYVKVKTAAKEAAKASQLAKKKKCSEAEKHLQVAEQNFAQSYSYFMAKADVLECQGDREHARQNWEHALTLKPAYAKEIQYLENKLNASGVKQ